MVGPAVTPALPEDRIALFLDVDGTLIDIAPRPEQVVVPGDLIAALTSLDACLDGALALVSGRTVADLDALFSPLRLRSSGVHGAEVRLAPDLSVVSRAGDKLSGPIVEALQGIAAAHAGTLVENKGFSVAVHYRANPAAGPALETALRNLVEATDLGLQVLPGHMVFEIKRAAFDKGLAIAGFLARAPFAGRRPVFIGDDITDLPGFAAVLNAGGLAFSVLTPRLGLSGHFDSPQDVRMWLAALAGRDG